MKVMYQTPEIKLVEFEIDGKLMNDGYSDGDVIGNPWNGVYDDISADDTDIDNL